MAEEMDQPKLLGAQQVADALAMPRGAVYKLVQRGELPAYRLGRRLRFDWEDVRHFLDGRRELVAP